MLRKYWFIIFGLLVVYGFNLAIDVMEVDAAQYAEMSWEMSSSKTYLKLYCLGTAYLDKPPLLFWLNSICMSIFGADNAAYKLPSLLFVLLAAISTYGFTKLFYDRTIAITAALMLATTQAVFLITNDVRTDTMLMGAVIFAIWQLAEYFERGKLLNLLLGAFAIGLAMLAKGPIGLIAPAVALFPYILLQKKWRYVFDVRIGLALLVIGLLLLPMCIGLNQQWGSKGLIFYFWLQSFGRITGESQWNNNPDPLFLLHTTAWAFLPWTLFLVIGWIGTLIVWFKNKFSITNGGEIISVSGFTLILIMLMLSKYQLPHYAFIVYPLGAVIAANCFAGSGLWLKAKWLVVALQIIMMVCLVVVSALLQYAMKGADPLSLTCLVLLYPLAIWSAFKFGEPLGFFQSVGVAFFGVIRKIVPIKPNAKQVAGFVTDATGNNLFFVSASVIIVFNFLLSAFYFPAILKYQPGNDFGRYVKQHRSADNNFVAYYFITDFSTVFYAQGMPAYALWDEAGFNKALQEKKKLIAITTDYGINALNAQHTRFKIIDDRYSYKVAKLTLPFLNPATRNTVCEKLYLIEAEL